MGRIYEVKASRIYARTGPQSWCIGNLLHGDHFEVERGSDTYAWGRAFERGFRGHCWVSKKHLSPYPHTKNTSHDQRFNINDIARSHTLTHGILNPGYADPRLTVRVEVKSKSTLFYRNYWHDFPFEFPYSLPPGRRLFNPLHGHPLHRGHPLGWRYTTNDKVAAMVIDFKHHPPLWGFVYRANIETPIQNRYFNEFAAKHPGKRNRFRFEPRIVHPEGA
jgi:hypothetical protein